MNTPTHHRRWSLLRWSDPTEPARWYDPERRIVLVHGLDGQDRATVTRGIEAVTEAERAGAVVVMGLGADDLRTLAERPVPSPRYIPGLAVERQSDLDLNRGHLLDAKARFRALVISPREPIAILHGPETRWSRPLPGGGWSEHGPDHLGIDLVVAVGSHWPIHPDWIRGLRDQSARAGVPFALLGWGSWLPITEATPAYQGRRTANVWRGGGPDPEDLPILCLADSGGSCRTFEDVEYLGVPVGLDDVAGAV
jgi:hypothetical protein